MHAYEIYILRCGSAPVTLSCVQPTDVTAILMARKLGKTDEKIEVWRGPSCVYSANAAGLHHIHAANLIW